MQQTKILLLDIETAPNLGYTWGKWEQDVIEFKEDWYILSYGAKWWGKSKMITRKLPDYPNFKRDKSDDGSLIKDLWELFDEADVIVAHNGDVFDVRKANARFIAHNLKPPSPYKTVDTKKVAKKYFQFDSNKLDELGRYLGIGRKLQTGGFKLWLDCMAGDKRAWAKMEKYNKQDVRLLEEVYSLLRPWMTNHPNVNVLNEKTGACPTCGSTKVQKRGFSFTTVGKKQRYQCISCGAWSHGKITRIKSIELR